MMHPFNRVMELYGDLDLDQFIRLSPFMTPHSTAEDEFVTTLREFVSLEQFKDMQGESVEYILDEYYMGNTYHNEHAKKHIDNILSENIYNEAAIEYIKKYIDYEKVAKDMDLGQTFCRHMYMFSLTPLPLE